MAASRPPPGVDAETNSEGQRLFLAWRPGAAIRARLQDLQDPLRPRLAGHGLRWVPAEQLHLTLRFLGQVAPAVAARLGGAMPALAAAHAEIAAHVAGWQYWPSTKAPRVLVLRLQSHGELERLAAQVEELVVGLGLPRAPRRFRAHLTLARIAAGSAPVQPFVEPPPAVALTVDTLALVRSTLQPRGALHEVLQQWPLQSTSFQSL